MDEGNIKLCDCCKTKYPANCFVQREGYYLIVCSDCSKELNSLPGELQTHLDDKRDISKPGIYEAEFSE